MSRAAPTTVARFAPAAGALPLPAALPRLAAGVLAGLIGGAAYGVLLVSQPALAIVGGMFSAYTAADPFGGQALQLAFAALAGAGFAALVGPSIATAGAALMWGVAYGLAWWLAISLTLVPLLGGRGPAWTLDDLQAAFPLLVGLLVSYGAVLGLAYWVVVRVLSRMASQPRPRLRLRLQTAAATFLESITIGGLAGIAGGLAFGVWMERADFYPLVAALVGSTSPDVGRTLHFVISVVIGATFGVLFRPDIHSAGASIAWGMAYGLIWWLLGPLTLMPWLLGRGAQWSLAAGHDAFPSLVGHIIYGLLLGFVYSLVARFWRLLFVESDPLNREPEGAGTRSLRALVTGVLASVAGGLVFTIVMLQTGFLPAVASLVGAASPVTGFVVHMIISAIVGATYGLLFQRVAFTHGAALGWGLVYGLAWWFLGPLTLMPVFLGAGIQWSLPAAIAAYPSLVGHLAYGGVTALAYQSLAHRTDPMMALIARRRTTLNGTPPANAVNTPAPALWALVLVAGVLLPLILSDTTGAASGVYSSVYSSVYR